MRLWMSLLLSAVMALAVAGEEAGSSVVDQPVRYVNDHVITFGDIRLRNGIRTEQFRRSGMVLPDSRDSMLRFCRDTLEELTDEELLVQQADELKVAIDRDRLSSDVIAEARERGLALRDLAMLRQVRLREAKVESVLDWFESRAADVTPSGLRSSYDQRQAEFARPPRARSLLIALRPTTQGERKDTVSDLAGLMRLAQQSKEPAIVTAATARLDAFLAADSAGQESILAEVASDIAALAGQEGLSKPANAIIERASELIKRWQAVRTREECTQQLEALRGKLLALPLPERADLFRAQALALSQGPHAADGGLLGWVEPGTYGTEIEEQALAMPVLEPSAPFWTGGSAAMVLVLEREEGRTQSFAEVSATLRASLERERRTAMRARVASVLRSRASITDLVDLGDLLR